MKTFHYRGYTREGRFVEGYLEADHTKAVREMLAARGVLAREVATTTTADSGRGGKRLNREQRSALYREWATLLTAGFPVAGALDMMIEAEADRSRVRFLAPVRDAVREGRSAAEAMAEAHANLSRLEVAALRAGEESAALARVLGTLADELDEQARIGRHVAGACAYPLFLFGLAAVIAGAVFGFLLPRFASLFADAGVELPWISRMLLAVGAYLVPGLVLLTGLALLAGWAVRRMWRDTGPGGRERLERRLLAWSPARWFLEPLLAQRFASSMAMLLESGVAVTESLRLGGAATGFRSVERAASAAAEQVRQGVAFHEAVQSVPAVPTLLGTWIRAGDAAGNLPGMLAQAGERCAAMVRRRIDQGLRWVEPVMVILVGLLVLAVALAILLPILSLNQSIGMS